MRNTKNDIQDIQNQINSINKKLKLLMEIIISFIASNNMKDFQKRIKILSKELD